MNNKLRAGHFVFSFVMAMAGTGPAAAADLLTVQRLSMEMARDIAQTAIYECRKMGYQVSAVVVDREAFLQAALRDSKASRFTLQIAEEKANAVILSGVASSDFRKNRSDIRNEMNHVRGILMLEGAVPIRSAGALVGALGVSGAPGGDKDEACAASAVAAFQDRLEFAH